MKIFTPATQQNNISFKKPTWFTLLLSFVAFIAFSTAVFAQTQPDGTVQSVNLNTNLKLWLDASDIDGDGVEELFGEDGLTVTATNDQRVDVWKDKATNDGAQDVTVSSATRKPFLVDGVFNGKPALDFDGGDELTHALPSAWLGDYTLFLAIQSDNPSPNNHESFFSNHTSHTIPGSLQISYLTSAGAFRLVGSGSGNASEVFGDFESGTLKLYSVRHDPSVNDKLELLSEGVVISSTTYTQDAVFKHYRINVNRNGNQRHNSKIAEVILYDRALTDCEVEEINLYLGNKYGRDFSGFTAAYTHTDFTNDVDAIGIKGSSCSANDQRDTAASAELTVHSPSNNTAVDEFFSFANNGNNAANLENDVPPGLQKRQEKAWRAGRTAGFLGTVDLTFDIAQTNLTDSGGVTYKLLIDADGTFATGSTEFASNGVYNNGEVTFSGVNLADGEYFAVAIQDTTAPTLTLEQAATQADPDTTDGTVLFTAIFNEAIDPTTFDCSDLTITGTASASCTSITEVAPNNGTTFEIQVDAISDGTINVVLSVAAITDLAGNSNTSSSMSTFTDFIVTVDYFADISFVTVWETTATNETITIPTADDDSYSYTIDWGDGTVESLTTGSPTHTYASAGDHTVTITGDFNRLYINDDATIKDKIKSIENWGDHQWANMNNAFQGASNLVINATDAPDLSLANTLNSTFQDCTSLTTGNFNAWDVSTITTMQDMFSKSPLFNGDLSSWNVSNVVNFNSMFDGCTNFNGDISAWNVSSAQNFSSTFRDGTNFNADLSAWNVGNATTMVNMFLNASAFNQPIGGWDVSKVTNIGTMFSGATSFNQPIGGWDVSKVTNMANTFRDAVVFNSDLSSWDVGMVTSFSATFQRASAFNSPMANWNTSNATAMNNMFRDATSFNQPIGGWDVSKVTNFNGMFYDATLFNQDLSTWTPLVATAMSSMFREASSFNGAIGSWNVSTVQDMSNMFRDATSFNQPIGAWNVSTVNNMRSMFLEATVFDQDLSGWNTAQVDVMNGMFRNATAFNSDISSWNVANVTDIGAMFINATAFDQDLGSWNMAAITNAADMLNNAGLSQENYDATLNGWATQIASLQTPVNVGALNLTYCTGQPGRDALIAHGWTFTGDSEDCSTVFANAFISTWETTNANESITIPTTGTGYDFSIDWGDGTIENYTTGNPSHVYTTAGNHTVKITGDFPRIYMNNDPSATDLQTIEQWGDIEWQSMASAFHGASYLVVNATDAPDLSNVGSFQNIFYDCTSLTGDFSNWDVSNVTTMFFAFKNATAFVGDLSNWNVDNVTTFRGMFDNAALFNSDLSSWNVTNSTSFGAMFRGATSFNSDLSSWNVSNATSLAAMFDGATAFNSDLSSWNVSNATNLSAMFRNASSFDNNLGSWNIASVTDAANMLDDSGLSMANYDATLNGWASQIPLLSNSLNLGALNLTYCAGKPGRDALITHGWTFTGDTNVCDQLALAEILEDSNSTGGNNNGNGTAVTLAQLNAITGLMNVVAGNIADYQAEINAETGFSNPPTVAEVQVIIDRVNANTTLLADIGTDASNGDNANTATVTADDLNDLTGVSGAVVANETAYKEAIAANEGPFSSPATEAEVQDMINRVNDASSLLADIGTDASNGDNANTSTVTADDLNDLTGVSGAVIANETAYKEAIAANEGTFSSPATEQEVQDMINRVNDASSLLADIGTDASNGDNANTATVTADDLNDLTGVSGAVVANETAYKEAIAANEGTFSSPATEQEVQDMINRVNDASSLLADIGTDASNGDNANTATVTADDLNDLTGVSGAVIANETAYKEAIAANEGTFSSPATEQEVQDMINRVNDASSLLADIGTDASNGDNANTATVTADDLNDLTGVSGAVVANETAYKEAIAANEGTFSSPATEQEVQDMINRVNDASSLLADIGTDASNGDNANTATVTADDLNDLTGVSGAIVANETAYKEAIAANEGTFSSPATEQEVQDMINRVNDASSLLADIGTDASNGDNANTSTVTADDLNDLTGVSGAVVANETAYKEAIAANEGTFSSPATEQEVQDMINRVNDASSLLADIGTDASNGDNANTATVTADDLNDLTGVSGAIVANETAYKEAIAANEGTFSSPATEQEVQDMINRVNDASSLLADIGTDASNGDNANTATVTADDLNDLTGVSGAVIANETAYKEAIAANEGTFSSPATEQEVQDMINRVNDASSLLADIGTDASNGDNANTATVTADDLNDLTGVSGAVVANETAYKEAIAANEGTFSSPATEQEVQDMINRVNDASSLLADIGTDASNGDNANTATVTADDLNDLTGVSGAVIANETAYKEAIAANEGTFSSPATEQEVQDMINRVNDASSLLADIGTDASNGDNANTATVTADDLNDLTGVSGAVVANETAYKEAIAANEGTFSSPATEQEVQDMINRVNDASSLLADIGTDASNGDNANTATVTADDLNDLTGVSGAVVANETAYKEAIAANEGTFSSPATEQEVQDMINRVNDASSLLADIGTDASNGDNANTATVTADDLNDLTGVSGAVVANETAYKEAIAANEGTFSSPATEQEVQDMINRVNDASSLLADIGTDASNGDNANTATVTADDLNDLTGVSGAVVANETAYKEAIAANEGTFSSPATEQEVQDMINRVNDASSLLADIGTDASNGDNANTATVTADDLNDLTGVSGAVVANETAYKEAIAANEGTFSSPATEQEVQDMINRVNDASSLLADIGTDASNGDNANTATVTADDLNDLTGVSGAVVANETAYKEAIAANEGTFSSPATEQEVQDMINRVNDASSLLADIGTDASNGDNANTATVTADDLNDLTGVSGAIVANETAYKEAIAANEGTFSSPATEQEVQDMINRVNDASSLLADIGTDASNGDNANTATVTADDLNDLTGVSGAVVANETAYKEAIAANEGTFSSPATEQEVQDMINRVNDASSLLADIGTDASNGDNANTATVTADDLNDLTGVSGAVVANETAYKEAIAANEGTFSSPATEQEVQDMINRVNDASSLLADIGTDASNGDNANTATVTADDLNDLTGVSGAVVANETAYKEAIAANEGTFSSPATEQEVQDMINRVNDASSLLADIGTDASNGDNANTATVTADDLNDLTGVSGAVVANETAYKEAIAANEGTFSSPATEQEVQDMINRVNDASSLLADIGTDASNGDNANTATVTADDLNDLTGVSGAVVANETAYKEAIAANEGTFSSPATEQEVQDMINRVNDASSLLADIGTDASNGDNANTATVTADDLNDLTGVSGAVVANETAYKEAIAANEGTFSSPATEQEVQDMINRVNDASSLLADIGTDASNGDNANTATVTADDLNDLTGVSGAVVANETAYKEAIAANEGTFSSPATEQEVQDMINRVNDASSLLADIGTDASNGDNANTATVTADDLNDLTGVSGAVVANETAYKEAIAANEGTFSSPATEQEVQDMINRVNDASSLLADIGTDASNGDNANTATVTADDLNDLTGVSGAVVANETAYKEAIAANEGTFSSPATEAEVQDMIDRVNTSVGVLAQIGNEGDDPDTVPSVVTITQLESIEPEITGLDPANEEEYQKYIDENPDLFSDPATVQDVQNMVNAVNTSVGVLAQIGNEGDDPDTVPSVVTVTQLESIVPEITGLDPANEEEYQEYIDENPDLFSDPATVQEVQDMVNAVNTSVGVLAQIGNEGDDPDTVPSVVTVTQLESIEPEITGLDPANEEEYQKYIDENPDLFSDPATVQDVQNMVNAVNTSVGVLAQIGNEGDDPDTVPSVVTVTQLESIIPEITGLDPANEEEYQEYIDENPDLFSDPATVQDVQNMVNAVNTSVGVLAQIGGEGDDPDVVPSVVTVTQLESIEPEITGLDPANEEEYQEYIDENPDLFSDPATVQEVQDMVNAVNTSVGVLAQIGNEGDDPDTVPSVVTVTQLESIEPEITGLDPANEEEYQKYIDENPDLFSDPATVQDVQNMVNAVNTSVGVLAQIGNEGDDPDTVPSVVTVTQLESIIPEITGLDPANEEEYQEYIDENPDLFSDPATVQDVQNMVNAVNTSVGVLAQIGGEGDDPDVVPSVVTVTQLESIEPEITGLDPANEEEYQKYIDENPDMFSDPATIAEIQDMVNAVNTSVGVLAQIGNEGDDPDTVPSVVTVTQLESIIPEITGLDPANEEEYQKYIDENPDLFSDPATVQDVQNMVNAINTSVGVLAQIGNEGDDPDTVPSVVTVTQLESIIPEITGLDPANEEEYQKYIDENPDLFSDPATVEEIQDLVNTVNEENSMMTILLSEILEDSNSVGGEDNANNLFITVSELLEIEGLVNIITENEEAYQKAINSETGFSNLPTIQEIQVIIDAVNTLMEIINEANDPADGNPSIGDLTTIGVTGLDPENESRYEEAIAKADPKPTSLAELQAIIDKVNETPLKVNAAEAFTPNGDGVNDGWVIKGIEDYPNNQVRVYNRSGHEVFAADGYQNDWNATYEEFSEKLPAGSYYYIINLGDGSTPIDGWMFINY